MLTYTAASGQEGIFDSQDNTLGHTVCFLDYEIYILDRTIYILDHTIYVFDHRIYILEHIICFHLIFLGLWLFAGF